MAVATTKTKNIPHLNVSSTYDLVAFWSLALLLFAAPFFRGLFFPENQRAALILAAIVFCVVCFSQYQRRDLKLFSSPFDYLLAALPLVYTLSAFTAANHSLGVDKFTENLLYFFVFWSAMRLVRAESAVQRILLTIYLTAIGVSLAGLLTASGFLNIDAGFLPNDGGIIASTFQYKNALASFLTASIFIGSYLWQSQTQKASKIAFITGNFVLMTVLFSSQSHGGYIVFSVFSILLWLLNPASKRLALIAATMALAISSLVESKLFLAAIADKNIALAWLFMAAGMALMAAAQYAVLRFYQNKLPREISLRQLIMAITIVTILGIVAMAATGIFQLLMNKLHTFGALERFTMYKDSLKMIKAKPLLGWGGGGWAEAYGIYQSYAYTSRQTHSYFLQLAIETGIIGLLAGLSIWFMYLITIVKLYKKMQGSQSQPLLAVLIASVLAIISHAVIDFNLSLAALTMVMYTLMACTIALTQSTDPLAQPQKAGGGKIKPSYQLAAAGILAVCVIIISIMLISAKQSSVAAYQAVGMGEGNRALSNLESSLSLNPLTAENYSLAAQLYQQTGGNREKANQYAHRATELAPYNPDRQVELALVYLKNQQNKEAVAAVQKAVSLAPLKVQYYEALADITTRAALNELKSGQKATALSFAEQALTIPETMDKILTATPSDKKELWLAMATPLVVSDKIKLSMGIANIVKGNMNEAERLINEAVNNPAVKTNASLWQALLAQKQGNTQKAEEILNFAQQDNLNIKKQFEELAKLEIFVN